MPAERTLQRHHILICQVFIGMRLRTCETSLPPVFFLSRPGGSHPSLQLIPTGAVIVAFISVACMSGRLLRCFPLSSVSATKMVPTALSGRQVLFQIRCWALHSPCSSRKLSLLSHFPLPLPTPSLPTSLPTSSTGLGYCQRKPLSCWGFPGTHLFWEKCLPSDLVPAQSLGLIAHTRCTNE